MKKNLEIKLILLKMFSRVKKQQKIKLDSLTQDLKFMKKPLKTHSGLCAVPLCCLTCGLSAIACPCL